VNPLSIDELARKFGSRFDLVVAAAKRAGQIQAGNPPLIETTSRNPLTIALEEIAAGKVLLKPPSEELLREPDRGVQDYLVRRGSLQDQIVGYTIIDEEAEEEAEAYEEELEEEEEFVEEEEEVEGPFAEEYEDEEVEFEFGFGEEPDQVYPEDLEEEAEGLEEVLLGEDEEEEEVTDEEESEEDD
jgi:DNA-directed RNA polymerase subunit omega